MEEVQEFRVGILGVGNMGAALARGMISRSIFDSESVMIFDLDQQKVDSIVADLGVRPAGGVSELVKSADLLILAAKPQAFEDLLTSLSPLVRPGQTVMSIAAGVTTASIEEALGEAVSVVRVMPNLPALVGEGISVYCRGSTATDADVERVAVVLDSVGESLEASEDLMDPVTALSGTGPAYIFHTMEAMIESGIEMGMSREIAERLVLQTVLGAAILANLSDADPATLRERVTSKGGTTEAAISHLSDNEYVRLVIDAILAARDRSSELGE